MLKLLLCVLACIGLAVAQPRDTVEAFIKDYMIDSGFKLSEDCLGSKIMALDNDENPKIMRCLWKGNTVNPKKILYFLHGNTFKVETATAVYNMIDVTKTVPGNDILIIHPISPQLDFWYNNTHNWAWFQSKKEERFLGIPNPVNWLECNSPAQVLLAFDKGTGVSVPHVCDIDTRQLGLHNGPLYELAKFFKDKVGSWQNMVMAGYSMGGTQVIDLVFGKMKPEEAPHSMVLLATTTYDNQRAVVQAKRPNHGDWKKRTNVRIMHGPLDQIFLWDDACKRMEGLSKRLDAKMNHGGCESLGPNCAHTFGTANCYDSMKNALTQEMNETPAGGKSLLNLSAAQLRGPKLYYTRKYGYILV